MQRVIHNCLQILHYQLVKINKTTVHCGAAWFYLLKLLFSFLSCSSRVQSQCFQVLQRLADIAIVSVLRKHQLQSKAFSFSLSIYSRCYDNVANSIQVKFIYIETSHKTKLSHDTFVELVQTELCYFSFISFLSLARHKIDPQTTYILM